MADTTKLHNAVASRSLSEISSLLDLGADIEIQDRSGLTPLHLAVKRNFVSGIDLLLEKGASVNLKDSEGHTLLHFAVLARNVELVQKLIKKGADKEERDYYGQTALHIAAYNNDWDSFDILLSPGRHCSSQDGQEAEPLKIMLSREYEISDESLVELDDLVNMKNDKDETPLHLAVRKSKCNLTGMLLDFGAQPDSKDNLGLTALHIAISSELELIVKLILDAGARVDVTNDDQELPLYSAIKMRNMKIMIELLNHGADKEAREFVNDQTPLIFAACYNFEPEFELLLERGADVNKFDIHFLYPINYVVQNSNINLFQKLLEKGACMQTVSYSGNTAVFKLFDTNLEKTVGVILDNKLDINMRDACGQTPLHYVSSDGALVELLLNNGADIEAADNDGETPLLTAVKRYDRAKDGGAGVEVLLKRGANVHKRNQESKTLLHFSNNNHRLVDILLHHGVDIEAKDNIGQTPIFNAVYLGDEGESLVQLLLQRGANVNAQDDDGKTPLHYSASLANRALVNVLLAHGANLELKDNKGETAFFKAVRFHEQANNDSLVTLLIERGASVNSTNNLGRTVLFDKMKSDLLKEILDSGADVSVKDENGQTALHFAMVDSDNIDHLIGHGANLLSGDNEGITPLQMFLVKKQFVSGRMSDIKPLLVSADDTGKTLMHEAVINCWLNCVKHLIDIGFDIDRTNKIGETPLHLAASIEDDEDGVKMIKELLNSGAKVNVQDGIKETPLHRAAYNGNEDMITALLVRGARMDILNDVEFTPLQLYTQSEPQYNIMKEHIVKLKSANVHEDITCNIDAVDCSEFESFRESCLKELMELKEYKFDCLSLIDVFRQDKDPMFASSNKMKEIITSSLLKDQFPIYDSYLKVKFEKGELRNTLLNSATILIDNVITENNLPNEILRKILSELTNEDLVLLLGNNRE